jgi:hypothetical protein
MKKIVLILFSAQLILMIAASYLAFIRKDVYVFDLNPRYQLQVNRASFTAVREAIKSSPDFRKKFTGYFSCRNQNHRSLFRHLAGCPRRVSNPV